MTDIEVTLPDGASLSVPSGSTVEAIAYNIGTGLGDDCVAGVVNGELVSKEETVVTDSTVKIVTPEDSQYRAVVRNSAIIVLGAALEMVCSEYDPIAGESTDEGFVFNLANGQVTEDVISDVVAAMEGLIDKDQPIKRVEYELSTAESVFDDNQHLLSFISRKNTPVVVQQIGRFELPHDGPTLGRTGGISAFDLEEVSAVHAPTPGSNEMVTRIRGTAFESDDAYRQYEKVRERRERREHTSLNSKLDLYSRREYSSAEANIHPNGMVLWNELEELIRTKNQEIGASEVRTPELVDTDLLKTTGHYRNFVDRDEVITFDYEGGEHCLKPVSCPAHFDLYDQKHWSYKDLPVSYFEFAKERRVMPSGMKSGINTLTGFVLEDGHTLVRPDQVVDELIRSFETTESIADTFGLEVGVATLRTKPDHSEGDSDMWDRAIEQCKTALNRQGWEYKIDAGSGCFYAPVILANLVDSMGDSRFPGASYQVDHLLPSRVGLTYTTAEDETRNPSAIHRVLFGSMERSIAILTEHFEGKFPFWLAPEQIRILPIDQSVVGYARSVADRFSDFRTQIHEPKTSLSKRIRVAHDDDVPYMIIVGDEEREAGTVAVRDRQERERDNVDPEHLLVHLRKEYDERRRKPDFLG